MSNNTWSGYAYGELNEQTQQLEFTGYVIDVRQNGELYTLWFDAFTNVFRGERGPFVEFAEGDLPALCTQLGITNRYFEVLRKNTYSQTHSALQTQIASLNKLAQKIYQQFEALP